MPIRGIITALCALFLCAGAVRAEGSIADRLLEDRMGDVRPGTYIAGDHLQFSLDSYGDKYLLRIEGDPEIYVLYAARASLGGRILTYDSGVTAIQVSGWGALTLYTDDQPNGLPCARTGDSLPPSLTSLSMSDIEGAAGDEAAHLAYARRIKLTFVADWDALAADATQRAEAFDAMENAARGFDRFTAKPQGRAVVAQHIDTVKIAPGAKPTIVLSGKTLTVTFVPSGGFAGRASSRAIARALGILFKIPYGG